MKFCTKCGHQLPDDAVCCSQCGHMLNGDAAHENAAYSNPAPVASNTSAGKINVGMLVWSIINVVLCCLPLGVVALIFSIMTGSSATVDERDANSRKAKIWNIVATCCGAVFVIFYIVCMIILISRGMAEDIFDYGGFVQY